MPSRGAQNQTFLRLALPERKTRVAAGANRVSSLGPRRAPLFPTVANILQVAYYRDPLVTRARMLESCGHHVTSVLGNDEAFRLAAAVIAASDLILIDFAAPYSVRATIIHWLKQHYPSIPIVALRLQDSESFPEADAGTVSDDPEVWLAAVASTLKKSS